MTFGWLSFPEKDGSGRQIHHKLSENNSFFGESWLSLMCRMNHPPCTKATFKMPALKGLISTLQKCQKFQTVDIQ